MSTQRPLPGTPPASTSPQNPPPGRLVSWLFTSVLVGWAIAYNILRVGGRSPRGAALTSLLIGLGIGAIIFAITWFVWRRVVGSGRYRPQHLEEIPPPSRLDGHQRTALDFLWPLVAALAAVAIAVGLVMAAQWYRDALDRGWLNILLAGWNVLVGIWLSLEARELRARRAEAVESIGLGAMLTAVLAGVALSREVFSVGQAILIALAGLAGAAASYAVWRILGSRGFPFGILVALAVAGLALALPLLSA